MANTPNIRFKGFTDDWEQHELCDIYGKIRNAFVGTASPYYVENGHFYLESNNVKDGHINHNNEVFINDEFYEKQRDNWLHTGDIVMVQSGHVGHSAVIPEELNNTAAHALIIISNPQTEIDPYFLNAEFQTPLKKKNIDIITKGNTIKHILASDMKEFEVSLPNIREQRDISAFFRILDKILIIHQRRLEDLKNFKKVMLQKMFPSDGESIPEIRFFGFSDAWEQRKLLDCIQKITDFRGRTPKKLGMDWSEEGYLALSALNVKDGYIDFNQDIHYGNQELYDKWMTGNELHKGQVLFTTEAPMGNVAQVPDNRRYILSQRVIALDVKDNLLTENFLATVLRTPTVFAYLTALSSGGTAKGVSQKSLSSVEIRLPKNLKEQEKIADTFSNLDHIIILHQHKYENLLKMKKYLLQQMFC